MNLGTLEELKNSENKHLFLIKTPYMTEPAWSEGTFDGGSWSSTLESSKLYYHFKTKDNPSKVGEIVINKGIAKVERMLYNRPIPTGIEILDYKNVPLYTEEEKRKRETMADFHFKLKRKCGYAGAEYLKINPTPLYISKLGKSIDVEYLTPNWFDIKDFINYRTNCISLSDLTVEEIQELAKIARV